MKAKAKETSARIGFTALAGAGMTFAFPALAFAAEGESSGGLSAILPDMAEFIPMLVIFILLWIVLAKFGWPKFEAMLEKREMTIKGSLRNWSRLASKASACLRNTNASWRMPKPRPSGRSSQTRRRRRGREGRHHR